MRKLYTGLLFAMSMSVNAQPPQKHFVRELEQYKSIPSGSIPPAVVWMDTVIRNGDTTMYVGGAIDSVWTYDRKGKIKTSSIPGVYNIVKKVGGAWSNGPAARTNGGMIVSHFSAYGKEYVAAESLPIGRVLNTSTNNYDSLVGINFNQSGYFWYGFEFGNNEVLFLGKGTGSFSMVNGESYRGAVIWNPQTNVLKHTTSSQGEGLWGHVNDVATRNDTVYVVMSINSLARVWGLKKGGTAWIENSIPALPCRKALRMAVIDNRLYMAVESSTLDYELHTLSNGAWLKLADLKSTSPGSSQVNPIKGILKHDDKLLIAGEFNLINGTPTNGIAYFDETARTSKDVAPLPSVVEMKYVLNVFNINGNLYLPSRRGIEGVGMLNQTLFILRDTTAFPPKITAPVISTITVSTVEIKGTVSEEPKSYIKLYAGSTLIGATQSDAMGNWSITKAFADGIYTVYAKSIDAEGNISDPSIAKTFTVNTVTGIGTLPQATPDSYFPNPASDVVHFNGVEKVLGLFDSKGRKLQVQSTAVQGSKISVDVSSLPRGMYYFEMLTTQRKRIMAKVLVL